MKILIILLFIAYGVGVSYYSLGFCSRGKSAKHYRNNCQQVDTRNYSDTECNTIHMPNFLKEDIDDFDKHRSEFK